MVRASDHDGQFRIGLAAGRNLAAGDAMAGPNPVRRLDMRRRDDPHRPRIDLGEDFAALRPSVPVFHMSGYTDRLWKSSVTPNFIQKPFTPTALLTQVRSLFRAE
jgi:hypothetical protein